MMKPIVAFDESGNTGSNLLDKDQPVFVFASVFYSQAEAEELVSLIPTNSVGERKFKLIKDRPTHWSKIESLLKHPLVSADHICLSVVHKPYTIMVHTVDRLIEEVAYRDGFDLYEHGANLGLANLLHMTLPVFCDPDTFEEYKISFVKMFRTQTPEAIAHFYRVTEKLIQICKDDQFKGILYAIMHSRILLKDIFAAWTKYNFDPALTGLFCLCDFWGKKLGQTFDVYADPSKPLQYFDEYIQLFKSPELYERIIGYDRRKMSLPLKIGELTYKDSEENVQVQVADIIAGAANHYFTSLVKADVENGLSEIIGRSQLVKLLYSPVWPHAAFTPQELGTEELGGVSLNDGMATIIADKKMK